MKFKEWEARRKDPEFASWSSGKIKCEFRGGPSGPVQIGRLFCLKSFTSAHEERAPAHLEDCKGCVQGTEIAREYRQMFGRLPDPKARKRPPADVSAIVKKIETKEEEKKHMNTRCKKCGDSFDPRGLAKHIITCTGKKRKKKPEKDKPKRKYVRRSPAVRPGSSGPERVVIFNEAEVIIVSNQEKPVEALIRARDAIEGRLREELGV